MKTVLEYHVNSRSLFHWPCCDPELSDPLMHIIDLTKNKKIVGLRFSGDPTPKEQDEVKHIWVRRDDAGALHVAPDVEVLWAPLVSDYLDDEKLRGVIRFWEWNHPFSHKIVFYGPPDWPSFAYRMFEFGDATG